MKIVIPGGSGQVGSLLARGFHRDGHEVVVFSRRPAENPWRCVFWDGVGFGGWVSELEEADVLLNLAGATVNCRYSQSNRQRIKNSRVYATRVLGEALRRIGHPPAVWLQASTATIYAHRFDFPNDEFSGILGGSEPGAPEKWNFSIDVALSWERAFDQVALPNVRKVKLRSAIILSPDPGGIFDSLLRLVRFGLGGRQGSGCQYVSWIHHEDFLRAVYWLIRERAVDGAVNLAAPNPLPNEQFMEDLRRAWGSTFGLPARKWMLEMGALVLRTETELVLKSRRVIPGRLAGEGFRFRYPLWREAACDLCSGWRAMHHAPRRA
ncbi:MAG TPA: TIGR01777 family oxidoreductase [Anaerolineales bacterium]|nr:TIGR01777 family oxidoreductase [Anaerolineales bacterium]